MLWDNREHDGKGIVGTYVIICTCVCRNEAMRMVELIFALLVPPPRPSHSLSSLSLFSSSFLLFGLAWIVVLIYDLLMQNHARVFDSLERYWL